MAVAAICRSASGRMLPSLSNSARIIPKIRADGRGKCGEPPGNKKRGGGLSGRPGDLVQIGELSIIQGEIESPEVLFHLFRPARSRNHHHRLSMEG
jgi:hypothetical protein